MVFLVSECWRPWQEEWQHHQLNQPKQGLGHTAFPELGLNPWVTPPSPCGRHSKSLFPLWTTRHAPVRWRKVIMNVNDLTRHGFHQGLTSGFLFYTVITQLPHGRPLRGSLWRILGAICPRNHSLQFRLGHRTSGFTLGSGATRNMAKCHALSMGCSRSRSKCLAGWVLLFPSWAQRFPFWRDTATVVLLPLRALTHPSLWCLPLNTQQARLQRTRASVTVVIPLVPLQLLSTLLQPLLLIQWSVALYSVPS